MQRTATSTLDPSDGTLRGYIADPVVIRSRVELAPNVERAINARLNRDLRRVAAMILRGTVQLEHAAGPRGRVETLCRIKLSLANRPSLSAEHQAGDPQAAFEAALAEIVSVLDKARAQDELAIRRRHRGRLPAKVKAPNRVAGSLIDRRVGHGPVALKRALARPEKRRRDVYVDTAEPGVSASDRRAGGGSTARRNTMARPGQGKQVAALEDSRTRPSRKSTRRSATRMKQATTKERTERGTLYAPSSQTAIARGRAGVPRRR